MAKQQQRVLAIDKPVDNPDQPERKAKKNKAQPETSAELPEPQPELQPQPRRRFSFKKLLGGLKMLALD
jgi:hypothetical protein